MFFFDRYVGERGRMMVARPAGAAGMAWQEPVLLFEVPRVHHYALARDGRSIYLVAPNPNAAAREIFVAVNWLREVLPQ